jgi:hypothetical protein
MIQPIRASRDGRDLALVVDLDPRQDRVARAVPDQRVQVDRRRTGLGQKTVDRPLRRV